MGLTWNSSNYQLQIPSFGRSEDPDKSTLNTHRARGLNHSGCLRRTYWISLSTEMTVFRAEMTLFQVSQVTVSTIFGGKCFFG